MKVKRPKQFIELISSHTVKEDDQTGDLEIVEVELHFEGPLSEWLEEYLEDPVGSRLHKNLVRTFKEWFE